MTDQLDTWIAAVGERSVAIAADSPPYWVDVTERHVLELLPWQGRAGWDPRGLARDAGSIAYSACRIGFAARRAECEALGEHEPNPHLAALLEDGYARGMGDDWWAVVHQAVSGLVELAADPPSDPAAAAALAPSGMGHDARARLAEMTVASLLARPGLDVGALPPELFAACWLFGYYLSACAASLPAAAGAELAAAQA